MMSRASLNLVNGWRGMRGLTRFGVNVTVIEAGDWSSQLHWHSHEDYGELTLITDAGEETLRAGDCAAFRSGDPDDHHLVK